MMPTPRLGERREFQLVSKRIIPGTLVTDPFGVDI
jgi:hypothetical protein